MSEKKKGKPQPAEPASGTVQAVHETTGEPREFSAETWRQMGAQTAPWRLPVDKPSEL